MTIYQGVIRVFDGPDFWDFTNELDASIYIDEKLQGIEGVYARAATQEEIKNAIKNLESDLAKAENNVSRNHIQKAIEWYQSNLKVSN